jgi:DNA-binding NarL/FixJ family response regulator
MIRILVADDHPVVREGLVAILSTQPDFEVVGEAGNGNQLIRLTGENAPDVVLLDLEMPEMDGVEALRVIHKSFPDVQGIVFTAFDTDERILAAVRAGARGYLLKGAPREEIFRAIRIASQGGSLLQPIVASKLLQHVAEPVFTPPTLTRREKEVLGLLMQGKANKEIAQSLAISVRTAKFHISSILHKLGAANRTEALAMASKAGLTQD